MDDLEQYNRGENLKLYGISEKCNHKDDGEDTLSQIAEVLDIKLDDFDIQRAHRLGTKRKSPNPELCPVISYKKRKEFMYSKANLKDMIKFKEAFIVEDLTPSRAKLINYVKKERNDEFVLGHTYNNACMYVCFFISQPQQHKTKQKTQ